jgi:hypothetical protein
MEEVRGSSGSAVDLEDLKEALDWEDRMDLEARRVDAGRV